jgi:hypothetical protein
MQLFSKIDFSKAQNSEVIVYGLGVSITFSVVFLALRQGLRP